MSEEDFPGERKGLRWKELNKSRAFWIEYRTLFLSFAIDLEPLDCPHAVPLRCVQTIVNREVPSLNWYNYSNCTKLFSMDNGPVSSLSVTPVANGGREPLKICQVGEGREGGRERGRSR